MKNKIMKNTLRVIYVVFITIIVIIATLFMALKLITSNISVSAKELFVTTVLETGRMKFLAGLFVSEKEIDEIVNNNKMIDFNVEADKDLIEINENNKDEIKLVKIPGKSFEAKMLIVNDPSRVKLSTIYPWKKLGIELHELVKKEDAIGGINGGLYVSDGNTGGKPLGVVIKNKEIQHNEPGLTGLHLIGLDEDNLLRIIDLTGMNKNDVEKLVKEEKIRDAVSFQDHTSRDSNHFVKLIINGKTRDIKGSGSGANPRTAIGQKKDGTLLLLVTDGRGKNGHPGATAKDLIKIMKEYGAINAANLDGGSSSVMYYEDKYEMTSVTLYYSNSSWRLPAGFVIEKR